MERQSSSPPRVFAGCLTTLSLAVALGTGCRSMRSEVPPHRPFAIQDRQAPPISYSGLDTHPADGLPAVGTGNPSAYGTPTPGGGSVYGAPTNNTFGPPGTSTLGSMPGGDATRPGLGGANPQSGAANVPLQGPNPSPFAR